MIQEQNNYLLNWLLDSDPSIRWQVLQDLCDESPETVAQERARVAVEGSGEELLKLQRPDGMWGYDDQTPLWQSTLCTLMLLQRFGIDPQHERVAQAITLVRDKVTWGPEFGDSPFFEGEVEPCINGRTLLLGAYFGHPSTTLLERLLQEQLLDGGWNCEAERGSVRSSFHTTICVLEGLLEYEQNVGSTPALSEARQRGQEYLLARRLFRRASTGEPIQDRKGNNDWTQFGFPPSWHYDLLRALEYFRAANVQHDERMDEALSLLMHRRNADSTWPASTYRPEPVPLAAVSGAEAATRWNTLRALRVLDWFRLSGLCPAFQ